MQFLKWFGIFSFLGYCFLANFYFLERATLLDNSFQLFSIIRFEDFAIQVNRFLAVFTQIFPLIGTKLNLDLEIIARLHTIAFPIIYGFCFYLIAFVFANKRIAIVFLCYHYLITSHSFFWPQCELVQGVSWFMVYVSFTEWILAKKTFVKPAIIIAVVILTSLIFMHPLIILVSTFYFLYGAILNPSLKKYYIGQLIIVVAITILKREFFENFYDKGITDNLVYFIMNFSQERKCFKLEVIYSKFISNYIFLNLLLAIVLSYLLYIKNRSQFILLLVYSLGLLFLVYIAYKMQMDLFYSEVQYNLIALFISIIAINYFTPLQRPVLEKMFYLSLFFAFCVRVIYVSDEYTKRLNHIESIVKNYDGVKVVLKANNLNNKILKLTWGSSFETWLLSTIKTGKSSSILITNSPEKYKDNLDEKHVWITEWETIDYEKLNPNYFVFKDTGTYVLK